MIKNNDKCSLNKKTDYLGQKLNYEFRFLRGVAGKIIKILPAIATVPK